MDEEILPPMNLLGIEVPGKDLDDG